MHLVRHLLAKGTRNLAARWEHGVTDGGPRTHAGWKCTYTRRRGCRRLFHLLSWLALRMHSECDSFPLACLLEKLYKCRAYVGCKHVSSHIAEQDEVVGRLVGTADGWIARMLAPGRRISFLFPRFHPVFLSWLPCCPWDPETPVLGTEGGGEGVTYSMQSRTWRCRSPFVGTCMLIFVCRAGERQGDHTLPGGG